MFCKAIVRGFLAAVLLLATDGAMADNFGTGENVFAIDFVGISGATNPTDTGPSGGYGIVNHDYRVGTYEITNDQWNKFTASLGVPVTGDPGFAYQFSSHFTDPNVPTNSVSWYEAAQFVNWLNTSTGHQAAYKFIGEQGTGDYALAAWIDGDHGYDAGNPYRNSKAFYFLPTEHEWVKAAYWNGTTLQLQALATKVGESLTQGHGTSGTGGWNYFNFYDNTYATDPPGPWDVGSGSQELNGTYEMMGNVWEWMESPSISGDYLPGAQRELRGGGWDWYQLGFDASYRFDYSPTNEFPDGGVGFRVASVPEPGSLAMLLGIALTALLYYWRKRV